MVNRFVIASEKQLPPYHEIHLHHDMERQLGTVSMEKGDGTVSLGCLGEGWPICAMVERHKFGVKILCNAANKSV